MPSTLSKVLAAEKASRSSTDDSHASRLTALEIDVSVVESDVSSIDSRVTTLEAPPTETVEHLNGTAEPIFNMNNLQETMDKLDELITALKNEGVIN